MASNTNRALSPSALIGGEVTAAKPMFEKQAKERMAQGGGDKITGRAKLPHPIANQGKARDHAAKTLGISGRTV